MSEEQIQEKILSHLRSEAYRPQRPRKLARSLELGDEQRYASFRYALKDLMRQGRVVSGARGVIVLPTSHAPRDEIIGTYSHNRRGFGFVVPTDPESHEDLYIPPGENGGAITGDMVRARITSRGQRDGRALFTGRITEILERRHKRFAGTLVKQATTWMVLPDGNILAEPILTPDAASRHIRVGTKVVVELTAFPEQGQHPQGVITEVLGKAGEKDVDLRGIIVQYNLTEKFSEKALAQARRAVDHFDPHKEVKKRLDLSDLVICTIDPDDAKDYDDAITLQRLGNGNWELGVHIADVSFFVKQDTPLDQEARERGNSTYFPGFVIPMLPEILSNGVCSLQEGVPRLCKSAFIELDRDAKPVRTRFANTVIKSSRRLRYREAQAIIDRADEIPHPDGARKLDDYPKELIDLLGDMNKLAKSIHKRRLATGQLVLDLPQIELVLDDDGRVVDAVAEDTSFTHTIIEMFMVEANEAVARLFDSLNVPFMRRVHPDPEVTDAERLRQFVQVAGHRVPKQLDRKALQQLLASVRGKPEAFAINLAVLKSLSRAEYSPQPIGHYALASQHYCHFTSPIRRYADLTVHRLLDAYFEATAGESHSRKRKRVELEEVPSQKDLISTGRHLSFTERRSEDAERELRKIKVLTLLQEQLGEVFNGVVTGITNFGLFIQLQMYLIDGLIRYEDLMDDWWDIDEKRGVVRGERTGMKIGIGDVVQVYVARVDLARRELELALKEVVGRGRSAATGAALQKIPARKDQKPPRAAGHPSRYARHRGRRR